ncbi:MAG: hypothetical protein AAF125_06005 [Chloroflexota bacterium]
MTIVQAVIEVFLLVIFLSVLTLILVAAEVAVQEALVTLAIAGSSYSLTVFNRDPYDHTDKHL